ncbi:MAG TPA: hypothetical protein PK397_12520 [Ignavibacteriaceae bacterium]|nr:hypothetical protein [Ignavibacteriaceae bacterium]
MIKSSYTIILFCLLNELLFSQFYFFGRNKVQYNDFDWKILRTKHFDIYYYDNLDEIAEIGATYAEEAYEKLKVDFNNVVTRRIPLIFYNTHIHFQQTNTTPGFIPEGVGGFFEFLKGRVVIPFSGSLAQFKHVITHELVHVFTINKLFRVYADHRIPAETMPPLWFIEGVAEFYSTEWDTQAEMMMRDALINNYFSGLDDLFNLYGTFLMYKAGQSFLEFVAERYGRHRISDILKNVWMFSRFDKVLEYTLDKKLEEIDKEWSVYLKRKYFPLIENNSILSENTIPLTEEGFSYSPVWFTHNETEYIYFIGNLDGYSSLYRIKVVEWDKKYEKPELVIRGEKSEKYEAFHLLQKSLTISKDGIIAFVVKSGPSDVINFFSIERNEIISTFQSDEIVSISAPGFSYSGDKIVFQATDLKGFNDLYLLDIFTLKQRRLTNDYYDDKEPVFSFKDESIFFASDRTSGENERVENLFSLDLETGLIKYVTNLSSNSYSPFLSKDGRKLFFISESDGVQNIWEIETSNSIGENCVKQKTSFLTGTFSPSFVDDKRIVYAGYEKGGFRLFTTVLSDSVIRENAIPFNFFYADGRWTEQKYSAKAESKKVEYEKEYNLDYAQSQVTTDPVYGTRGGAFFALSDILGDDNYFFVIYNTAEVQSDLLKSFNVALTRVYLGERTNYGFGVFHFMGRRYDIRDSDEYFYERSFGGVFMLSFPLSKFDRIETSLTIANSDKQVIEGVIERKALLWNNSISYVFDNSLWSPSGPIDGTRMKFQLAYTSDVKYSNVNYFSVIADYREYIRLSFRSALAFRASLYYNEGKEARRYFMGGSWDLRGWPRWSIRGEKMWISSLEYRFPLIDAVSIKFPFIGLSFLGIRGAVFFDTGGAWDKGYNETLGSVGAGFRFNLFNILVLRYDIGKKIEKNFTEFQNGLFYQFFFGWDF